MEGNVGERKRVCVCCPCSCRACNWEVFAIVGGIVTILNIVCRLFVTHDNDNGAADTVNPANRFLL